MRGVRIGLAALAAGLIFVCAEANADTIRFGGILPLTGPGALIGTAEMHGVQFAVDQANAKGGVHLMTPLILRWHRTFVRRGAGLRASGRTA